MTDRVGMPVDSRLALLEQDMETILGNGKPGLLDTLRRDVAELKAVAVKNKGIMIGTGFGIALVLFLTGSGTITLKSLIQLMGGR